jgi:hypothetical protein
MNLVTLKAVAKYELMLDKPASEVNLLSIQVRLKQHLSLIIIIAMIVKNLVTPKAVVKYDFLFNKPASEVSLLSMQVRLKQHLSLIVIIAMMVMNLVTLKAAAEILYNKPVSVNFLLLAMALSVR